MGNNAVYDNPNYVNGGSANVHINSNGESSLLMSPSHQLLTSMTGSCWYFAVCAVMGLMTIAVLALGFGKTDNRRLFYYITAGVNAVACVAYFSMGSNLGWTPIGIEFLRTDRHVAGLTREIFYVRYIDW